MLFGVFYIEVKLQITTLYPLKTNSKSCMYVCMYVYMYIYKLFCKLYLYCLSIAYIIVTIINK